MSSLWQPNVDTDNDTQTNNPFSFGLNGRHSGQYIADKLDHHPHISVVQEHGYFNARDCEGRQVGFPDRGLDPCEYRHIKSMVFKLWAIRLCFAAFVGFAALTIYAL